MGRSTWRRSLERRPGQARAKKPQPASLGRMGAPERERDESDWKRYGQTAACFRVTRSRDRGIISRNGEISKLSAGKLRSQRLPDDWGWLPRRPSALSAFANGEFHTHAMTAIQSFIGIDISPFTKASNCINAVFAEPTPGECYNVAPRMRWNRVSKRNPKHLSTANAIRRRDQAHS